MILPDYQWHKYLLLFRCLFCKYVGWRGKPWGWEYVPGWNKGLISTTSTFHWSIQPRPLRLCRLLLALFFKNSVGGSVCLAAVNPPTCLLLPSEHPTVSPPTPRVSHGGHEPEPQSVFIRCSTSSSREEDKWSGTNIVRARAAILFNWVFSRATNCTALRRREEPSTTADGLIHEALRQKLVLQNFGGQGLFVGMGTKPSNFHTTG